MEATSLSQEISERLRAAVRLVVDSMGLRPDDAEGIAKHVGVDLVGERRSCGKLPR